MSFKKNKYTVLKKAISPELAEFVYKYFLNKGITIPDDWFDIYLQNISIIDEIYILTTRIHVRITWHIQFCLL